MWKCKNCTPWARDGDESVTYPFQCLSYRVQIIRQRYYVVIRGGNFKRAARRVRRPCCFLTLTTVSLPVTSLLMEYNDLVFTTSTFFYRAFSFFFPCYFLPYTRARIALLDMWWAYYTRGRDRREYVLGINTR